ncbi:MAG: thioredoxin domain-containing protein [Deltaproteobacteria bacterium]|nr:thioredoxin domain-containing protein [Deltaproteobacteria bacterium]
MTTDDAPPPAAPSRPDRSARELALQAICLVGLAASAMLMVDYIRPPVFCADQGSGCDAVRHSVFARPFGVPLPIPGVLFFVALLGASLLGARERARRLLASLGLLGVVAGVALVAIQGLILHHWCVYCLTVDASSLVAGALAMSLRMDVLPADEPAPKRRLPSYAVTGAALLSVLLPLGYGLSRPMHNRPIGPNSPTIAPLPEVIARLQERDVATIVEFVDFECPFCRRQQEALAPVLASYGSRVRVIRKNVPLSFHEHARDAARATCCAEEQGRGDAVAAALFRAEDLTPAGCERVVRESGVDMDAWRACLASRRPDAALERDMNDARSAGVSGLPTLYVGVERFEGLTDADTLRASIERALRGARSDAASHAPQGG